MKKIAKIIITVLTVVACLIPVNAAGQWKKDDKGITTGLNDGTGKFGVGQKCTRAMIVTFLYRTMNESK